MQLALFIIFAALAIAGAINLLLQKHPINSALSLVVVMMSLAVLYWTLGAEFLAFLDDGGDAIGIEHALGRQVEHFREREGEVLGR